MRQLWESRPTDLPDGFGVARSGRLYVPLAGRRTRSPWWRPTAPSSSASRARPASGDNGSPVPFDTPSSARFLGTRLIVANQSFTGNRDNQALLDVETGEPGLRELIPGRDSTRPRLSGVSLSRKRVRAGAHRRDRVRFTRERALHGELPHRAPRPRARGATRTASRRPAPPAAARSPSTPTLSRRAATACWSAPRTARTTGHAARPGACA